MNGMPINSTARNGAIAADLAPGRAAERAERPERDVAQLAVVGDEQQEPDRRRCASAPMARPASSRIAIEVRPLARRDAIEQRSS